VQQCQGFGAPFCDRHAQAPVQQRAAWLGVAKRRIQRQTLPRLVPTLKIANRRGIWFGPENAKIPNAGDFGVVIFVGGAPRQREASYVGNFHWLPWPLQLRALAPAIHSTQRTLRQQGKVLICGQLEGCRAVAAQLTQALHVTPAESNRRRWAR